MMRLFFGASKKKKCGIKKPALFIIFGTYYDRVKKWLELLKTGTFVLFQHFNMHAYMMRLFFAASKKKKCGIKKTGTCHYYRH